MSLHTYVAELGWAGVAIVKPGNPVSLNNLQSRRSLIREVDSAYIDELQLSGCRISAQQQTLCVELNSHWETRSMGVSYTSLSLRASRVADLLYRHDLIVVVGVYHPHCII